MFIQTSQKRELFASARKKLFFGAFVFVLVFVGFSVARPIQTEAATSSYLNFQARLQTATGAIVPDGNYNIEFKLYSASTGGSALWTEDYLNSASQGVHVANGYVTVNLGSITAFPSINWDQQLWLTMNIGGTTGGAPTYDGEMSPRLQLTAVPYAFKAGQLAQFNSGTGFTSTLGIQNPTGGNQTFVIPDQGVAGTYNLLTTGAAVTGFVQLQGSTPGSAQTGNFNISGAGIAGSLQTTSLDTTGAGTLSIGIANATDITFGSTSATGTITLGQSTVNNTIKIGDASTTNAQTINIGTGATGSGRDTITIGSTVDGSATTIQGGTGNINLRTNSSGASIIAKTSTNSTIAFQVQNSGNNAIFTVDTIGNRAVLGTTGNMTGQLTFKGATAASGVINLVGQTNPTGTQTITLPDGSGTLCLDSVVNNCSYLTSSTGLQLQASTPGTAQTGHFNISGTGIAGSLQATSLDTTTAVALNIGTANATVINLNQNTTVASGKTFQVLGASIFQDSTNSATAFQVLDTGNQSIFGVDTSNGKITLGAASTRSGQITFFNSSGAPSTTIVSGSTSASYTTVLPTAIGVANQCLSIASVASSTQNLGYTNCLTTANGIQLQASTPGSAQTGNFNITGKGIAGTLQASVLSAIGAAPAGATSGNGANQATVLSVQGSTGQATIGTTGQIAGQGSNISIQAGNGGNAVSGSQNGAGGNILLSAGASGTGGSVNDAGSVIIQDQQNGPESLVVKDTSNSNIFAVSTATSSIVLGNPSTRDGNIVFQNSGNTNTVEFSTGLTSASYSIFLPTSAGTVGQCLYIASKPSSVDEQLGHTDCLTTATGIQLQASTPGTAQTGNFNISGTGIAGNLRAGSLDTASAGTLSVGNSNATTLNIATNAAAHSINIGTGNAAQTMTIGSTNAGSSLTLQGGDAGMAFKVTGGTAGTDYDFLISTNHVFTIDNVGRAVFRNTTDTGSPAFSIQDAAGNANFLVNNATDITEIHGSGLQVNSAGILDQGALSFQGTTSTTFTTPLGSAIPTKVNVPLYDPGAFGQIIALGLPSTASSTARAITFADARTVTHQPTISLLSPDENQIAGLSWDGSNTSVALKSTAGQIALKSTTSIITQTSSNSATAFQVQNASGTALFNLDSTNATITFGDSGSGNYVTFSPSSGLQAFGTARHSKNIVLTAQYAGAVLDAASDSGGANCATNNTGTMSNGYANGITGFGNTTQNYYKWTTASGTNQCYDVIAQVKVPSDWSAWDSSVFSVNAYTSDTTNGKVEVQVLDTTGTAETNYNYANLTPGSATTWTTKSAGTNTFGGTYTAGSYMTVRLRLTSPTSGDVRIGNITLNYLSKF